VGGAIASFRGAPNRVGPSSRMGCPHRSGTGSASLGIGPARTGRGGLGTGHGSRGADRCEGRRSSVGTRRSRVAWTQAAIGTSFVLRLRHGSASRPVVVDAPIVVLPPAAVRLDRTPSPAPRTPPQTCALCGRQTPAGPPAGPLGPRAAGPRSRSEGVEGVAGRRERGTSPLAVRGRAREPAPTLRSRIASVTRPPGRPQGSRSGARAAPHRTACGRRTATPWRRATGRPPPCA
jgi:hypothetical protein